MTIMLKLSSCPTCGSQKMKKVRRSLREAFRGQTYTIPGLEFYACPDCGEHVYDRAAMRKIEAFSPAFARSGGKKKIA
jgi:YgiT-type zinc finger domain-containing protein